MPSIYGLKPRFQALLRPAAARLAGAGISANQITLTAVLLSLATGACIALWPQDRWPMLLVPAALLLRMALNALDGMLAREFAMKTRLGAILNELGDVISDAALYLPFALVGGVPPVAVVLIVILAVISEMTGVLAVQIGAERRYDGPMGKSDRAFAFGLLALLLGLGLAPQIWAAWLLWAVVALLLVTIFNRARRALAAAP
jgi:CDP-diacylglycerol--glycerol-3-phosphate 3-phosphatidyltransferase